MADDMVTRYLRSRGADALSAENASRVRQHFASNPDLLDRRAMGLPGGLDDNSSVLDALLDKHIAESMPTPAGSIEVGQPVRADAAPAPSRRGPTTQQPMAKQTYPVPNEAIGNPNNIKVADKGSAPIDGSITSTGTSNQLTGPPVGSQVGPTQRSGITELLMGLLGAGGAAYGLSKMGGKGATPDASTAPLPGTVPPAAATAAPVDATDPATMRARMQAEIDAENDAMYRQMEQDALQRKRQQGTQETLDAAARQRREFGQAAKRFGGRR